MTTKQNAPRATGRGTQSSFDFHTNYTTQETADQFNRAIADSGLPPPNHVIADGKIHRFPTKDQAGDDAGWYVLHLGNVPAGKFGDWRTGIEEYWRGDVGRALSPEEKLLHKEQLDQVHQQAASAKAANHENSRGKAESIWMAAVAAPADHPYLIAKTVQSHGLKLDGGQLVVPMRIGDTLHSLQFINVDGKKRFLTGGRKKGCYQLVGTPGEVLCIAEGYATAASIHEATGYPVAVAFDAGNLKPVGEELARHYPDSRLLFCADNDRTTDGNLGLSKAKLAAKAVGGSVAVPEFPVGTPGTDFNDLLQACGSDALQTNIGKALAWLEPLPISVLLQRQQYPIDALPPDMRNAIEEVRSFVQAPVPMIATSAFGALALAIQGLVDVRRADTLTGPVSLFTLTIAESGERKTTVDNYFTTAVREYEMEKGKELEPDVHAYRTSLTVWNAKHQGLQDKIRTLAKNDKPTGEFEVKLAELGREKPRPVKVPHLIRTDETPEHLAIALQDGWPSAGIVSSEAGTVLGSHAMN